MQLEKLLLLCNGWRSSDETNDYSTDTGVFDNVGGAMPFTNRMAIANRWLLNPVLLSQLTKNNSTNALVRTTTALTMMKGSDGTNVLSPEVEFVVNFRLLPGNTVKDLKDHIAKATKGFDVEIEEVDNTGKPLQCLLQNKSL